MDINEQVTLIKKLEKKKKWEDASKAATELAEYYTEKDDFKNGLKYFEQAITIQQKEKKAEKIIVLYRKIIGAARKGKNRTKKELFRYAAAAIPLIEEYIKVLEESKGNRYISKHGAMTRYFLGECREIVSGIKQRDEEFLRAGRLFVEVGRNFVEADKSERDINEAFEKARIIFDLSKNREEIFKTFLIEAEINIRNYRLERGFTLFDEARGVFDDEIHQGKVVDVEKDVYSEVGLQLLKNYFSDEEQHKIADTLITKSREAHLLAKSLDKVPSILFEIGRINIENKELEIGFNFLDEAITNSQLVGDDITLPKILKYLFEEGKKLADTLLRSYYNKLESVDIEKLSFMPYFNKIEEICKKYDRGQEIEEVALYIWKFGLNLTEKELIHDDFPFIDKAVSFLIDNNRLSGLQEVGDHLEKRIDDHVQKKEIEQFEKLKTFLVNSYKRINDISAAGFLSAKIAQIYGSWGNYDKQIACLHEVELLFQNQDQDTVKAFCDIVNEQFNEIESLAPYSIINEVIYLLGKIYLQLQDGDNYDSLFARYALKSLESDDFYKAMEYHQQDFDFLVKTKNFSRANARIEEFCKLVFPRKKYQLVEKLRSSQVELLVSTDATQEQILETIKSLEDDIGEIFSQKDNVDLLNNTFNHIAKLYDFLGLKEAQGDAAFEIANRLFEIKCFDPGFDYISRAYEYFREVNVIDKYGLLMDYAFDKKNSLLDKGDIETAGRFLDFLIAVLKDLGQIEEASKLIVKRAVQLVPIDEERSKDYFKEAEELVSQLDIQELTLKIYQDYGSALLRAGKIDEGMEKLAQAQGSSSINSLSIADTCLTIAEDKFAEKNFDIYFLLIDRALAIYTELEMNQESSSIALAEARKLWSVNNLPYTMIFLERSWAPLSLIYNEKLDESIQPLLQVAEEVTSALFEREQYDEAKNFLEFQERIYKHLNLTEKILEVEKRKIHALIGRGNLEGAISQFYDIVTIGVEESKINEAVSLLTEFLPIFVQKTPLKAKPLLKMFFNLSVSMEPVGKAQKFVYDTLDYYISRITETLVKNNEQLFKDQIISFIESLEGIEDNLAYFVICLNREVTKIGENSLFFSVLQINLPHLQRLKPQSIMKIIDEIYSIIYNQDLDQESILNGLDFLDELSLNLDDVNRESVASVFLRIGEKYKSFKDIYNHVMLLAFQQSKQITDVSVSLNLIYEQIENELEIGDYLNVFGKFDEAIEKLEKAPKVMCGKFLELLDKYIIKLTEQKKKKWLDLLKTKQEIISEKCLGRMHE